MRSIRLQRFPRLHTLQRTLFPHNVPKCHTFGTSPSNMAAVLCRLVKILSVKKHMYWSFSKFLYAKRYVNTRKAMVHGEEQSKLVNDTKSLITYGILVASGFAYGLRQWKDELLSPLDNYGSIIPTIHAKKNFIEDVSQNRDRFNFIADVVAISAPSVVYIEIKDQKRIDFLTGKPTTTSNGSGFIVKEDGLILTNAHVVINKPNTLVKVRLHDGNTYTGTVEDIDLQSDLATVRIDKKDLPVMKLGSSSNIRPGEFVVAIGSPLSLNNTITSGVVSSVNRASAELGLHNKNMGYIQTDAAITFGNSGGPLVNLSGEAIGINAMKVTAGISFAIPIDYAKDFLKRSDLRRKNKATASVLVGIDNPLETNRRRYMGVTMLTLSPDILSELQQRYGNVPHFLKHGVLVWRVVIGSPAYIGGLRAGDIVTHVNNDPVITAASIYDVLERAGSLTFKVLRNGETLHMKIEPEDV